MKKRFISLITVIALIMCMPVFANAAGTVITIDNAAEHKAEYLSGNNLLFSAVITGANDVTFSLTGDTVKSFYNDDSIRYYTFTFNNLTVRTEKNNFYDFDLQKVDFKLTNRSFNVIYHYTSGSSKNVSEAQWFDLRYTVTGATFTTHTAAKMGDVKINATESTKDKFVFETKLLGAFTPYKFEFSDVADSSKWYYRYINEAGAYGIVGGVGNNMYQPLRSVTRAELATLIVEATKHIITYKEDPAIKFSDVNENAWYYTFVNKCAQKGLMSGVGDGKFNPTATATRQEIAEVTANFVKLIGSFNGNDLPTIDENTIDAELAKAYTDSKDISGWAKKSTLLCYKLELMQGDGGKFYPKRQVTRAESAKIFNDLYFKSVK